MGSGPDASPPLSKNTDADADDDDDDAAPPPYTPTQSDAHDVRPLRVVEDRILACIDVLLAGIRVVEARMERKIEEEGKMVVRKIKKLLMVLALVVFAAGWVVGRAVE
ncbi:hypothetical protein K458DRAFT_396051 [Lentithecium fluviatile CBS 122367]|uniref:Uncharacterized protein n=1 Tax=Lentithecium fluviatile CBS 122367 TaxID=1168545 RepID=A0A6G1IGK0_9PLEO|nr:hypothetical protein K458DRAFT_396051 [Lentithecium fluviatile CBS 122367]